MIDIAFLRRDKDQLTAALLRRGRGDIDVEALAILDEERRRSRSRVEAQRAEQKKLGSQIARLAGSERETALAEASRLAAAVKQGTAEADRLDAEFESRWIRVPNPPHSSAPDGAGEEDNQEVRRWGEPPVFAYPPLDHLELGEALGLIDTAKAVSLSGSRFAYLKGRAVQLEFALVRWALDHLVKSGFTPVVPPVLVREEAMFGTGFFPDDAEQVYRIEADDLYLVGTSEVSLAALHANEILETPLPIRYVGFSTCFRRESGTYGKDTRGIFRVHQFDKLEMFSFAHPQASWDEHEFLLAQEEELVQELGIPYRVVNVCTADLGASAAKKYDLEAWIPSQAAYREITSCSNTTDFQARRLKIRFRGERGPELTHTLNGTAVAIGRMLIALLENNQQPDGSVRVPEALVAYAGFDRIGG